MAASGHDSSKIEDKASQNTLVSPTIHTSSTEKHSSSSATDSHSQVGADAPPHVQDDREILKQWGTNTDSGLSATEAKTRREKYGDNILRPPPKPSPWKLLGRQVLNAMTLVLIAAMAVSFGTQDWIAAGVIAVLVFLNVSVGFSQEWKAEKTVAALSSVGAPTAVVLRDGKEISVSVEEVVPGDIILLSPGSIVPADGRLLTGFVSNLEIDEALLTGESLPVAKDPAALNTPDCPLGDRINMVYAGSQVSKGRARAIVVTTGMNTELGKIAEAIEKKVNPAGEGWAGRWYKVKVALGVAGTTPLQMKLNKVAYLLLGCAVVLAIIVVASTAFVDIDPSIATYAVATAVSILPASLIAVVSLTLATASRELAKRNALVRKMDAIEGLAVVTDICSDKTGTLTLGKMVTKKVWVPASFTYDDEGKNVTGSRLDSSQGQTYEVASGSEPYYPHGSVRALSPEEEAAINAGNATNEKSSDDEDDDREEEDTVDVENLEDNLANMVQCASLCNMATIHKNKDQWEANGDATEVALQVFAHKLHRGKPALTKPRQHKGPIPSVIERKMNGGHYDLVIEHPFDSSIKRMSAAWQLLGADGSPGDRCIVYMKGALERVLDRCTHVGLGEDRIPLDESTKEHIHNKMEQLAAEGLRVLCLSGKIVNQTAAEVKEIPRDDLEANLSFLGLAGIFDPPRPESRTAVLEAQHAGITTRMLTGDHPATAAAIAKSVAIIDASSPASAVMTGVQFDKLSDEEIDRLPELPLVIARCAPETKVKMVDALHRRKIFGMTRFTIMTGDGVNDSPALKRADVGIAMGLTGSDVAKSVSDIVLADDNFASITRAIRKGRATLVNLSKFLLYLLSGNVAEVVVLMIGLAFKNEVGVSTYPLSPVAALWINTIAAGPPALALGLEPTAKDAMDKSPAAYKTIFTMWWFIDLIFYGFMMGSLSLVSFIIVVWGRGNGDLGRDCNEGAYNASCELLFHGRAACFATLCFILMLHALTCKHLEHSIFRMTLLDNKFLLWSVSALSLSVFPILYIPRISDYAFQVLGLGWEWGPVFGLTIMYVVIAELYKLVKRKIMARNNAKHRKSEKDDEKYFPRLATLAV